MRPRNRIELPPAVYPRDPWTLAEEAHSPRFTYLAETIFALSNGYLGVRATLDEGTPTHAPGTFVNGFHETWPIIHAENAYGLAKVGQTIVNVPDATTTRIVVDGEPLSAAGAAVFRRSLDFREGLLTRRSEWITESGARVVAKYRRMVSLDDPHLAAFELEVEADRPVRLTIDSRLINHQDESEEGMRADDPRRAARLGHRVLEPRAATVAGQRFIQSWATANSGLGLVTAVHHVCEPDLEPVHDRNADDFGFLYEVEVEPDASFRLTKYVAYVACPGEPGVEERTVAEATLEAAVEQGFEALAVTQRRLLADFWEYADVEADVGPEPQRAIRWSLFQLHQASARLQHRSIPAKGLTGQAYDGHYFWDTEVYVLPFLVHTNPEAAAEILRFRYQMLPAARRRASELSQRGALFPWRTITGDEASSYFPAGTAQYHIDADIVYALRKYVQTTGDIDLLFDIGVEIAAETARMWCDLGFFRANRFHIHGVTGPDEYTALVDDNAYTNAMARMNLRFAAESVERMRDVAPERFAELAARIGLDGTEPVEWRQAADAMYIPHDPQLGITPQDDDFLSKEPWDFANTPPSHYPLLLHYHPLVIYRYQVLKQADVVLMDFLLGSEFSAELKRANFEFYDPITTGDSSLSVCIESIVAAEVGHLDRATEHFDHALFMDLADLAGNTTDGVHMASAGGVWLALVYGFGGFRDHEGTPSFDPRLPRGWGSLRFRLRWRRTRLSVEVTPTRVSFTTEGPEVQVVVRGEKVTLAGDDVTVVPLTPG